MNNKNLLENFTKEFFLFTNCKRKNVIEGLMAVPGKILLFQTRKKMKIEKMKKKKK